MARLGVCLEPGMCFLMHEIPGEQPALSTEAKEFNPFAQGAQKGAVSTASKEFVPPQQDQPQTAQQGIISMLSRMGMEAQVDPELGTIFIKQVEDCDCCHGLINNCNGDICEQLGMCYCVAEALHEANDY